MKEKELRLAAVFYGGVSLAVYQHGINKELLNLLRASKAYHAPGALHERQAPTHTFGAVAGAGNSELATAEIYFDLLKAIGQSLDLRVILDVISGSSAGAINGLALARAVAHDLSLEPLTDLWLAEADMTRLLAPEARARMWSKWYFWPFLTPLIAGLRREGLLPMTMDAEMRRALSTFFRSRWFNPPLDGRRLATLLLDGLGAMGESAKPDQSLLPKGQRLDLLITVTDYYGTERLIPAHDPPVVRELEHRHLLQFSCKELSTGEMHSEFGLDNLPALAFAGRASASYPGAFPPAQLSEIEALVSARGLAWPMRAHFLETNFAHYRDQGRDPADAVLVDGSILNNKPIAAAVDTIKSHGAFREVDRRLVYIDPHPHRSRGIATRVPNFFATLRGALSTLPRNQPIYDEIADIAHYNEQLRALKNTMAAVRPQVRLLVDEATAGGLGRKFTPRRLTRWRLDSANLLGRMGLVQAAWFRAMLLESVSFLTGLINGLCGYPAGSVRALWVGRVMESWSVRSGIFAETYQISREISQDKDLPPFATFIVNFGIGYKRRRLTFVIQTLNDHYATLGEPGSDGTSSSSLDNLKRNLYHCISLLTAYDEATFISDEATRAARDIFGETATHLVIADKLSDDDRSRISALVNLLSDECGVVAVNQQSDEALSSAEFFEIGRECRRDILTSYLGFVYWDAMLYPTTGALNVGAGGITEVLIDRISPEDATGLRLDDAKPVLQGGAFVGFAGFLSRTVRENDYLWGRLHAVERLLDIVASTAGAGQGSVQIDIAPLRRRAFEAVLTSEKGRLKYSQKLIEQIEALLAQRSDPR